MDDELDECFNAREIEIMIEKLLNPVAEIRWRALKNILSKLNYGLLKVDRLIEIQNGKLCKNLLKWFSLNNHSQSEFLIVLKFLHNVIKETSNGIRILINMNARNIIQEWVTGHIENEEITMLVRNICSDLGTVTQMKKSNGIEHLQYGELYPLQENDELKDDSLTENSLTISTNSVSSPARFLIRNRENHLKSRLPKHLLEPILSSSEHSGVHNSLNENRIYSPISRSYLKRKVTFSQNTEEQELTYDDTTIGEDNILNEIFPLSSLLSEWHTMEKVDRDLLEEVGSRLKASEVSGLKYTLQEISSFVIEDFPAEVLLQRPDIIFFVLDIVIEEKNLSAKISAVRCLEKTVKKLQYRLLTNADAGLIGRTSYDKTYTDSLLSRRDRYQEFQGNMLSTLVDDFCGRFNY